MPGFITKQNPKRDLCSLWPPNPLSFLVSSMSFVQLNSTNLKCWPLPQTTSFSSSERKAWSRQTTQAGDARKKEVDSKINFHSPPKTHIYTLNLCNLKNCWMDLERRGIQEQNEKLRIRSKGPERSPGPLHFFIPGLLEFVRKVESKKCGNIAPCH